MSYLEESRRTFRGGSRASSGSGEWFCNENRMKTRRRRLGDHVELTIVPRMRNTSKELLRLRRCCGRRFGGYQRNPRRRYRRFEKRAIDLDGSECRRSRGRRAGRRTGNPRIRRGHAEWLTRAREELGRIFASGITAGASSSSGGSLATAILIYRAEPFRSLTSLTGRAMLDASARARTGVRAHS